MSALPENVRQERSGWRDERISTRHRQWGWNCPAVDLDFLMVEYNIGRPVGLVEYKHCNARRPNLQHATYRALSELANVSSLPFLVAFYWPEIWAFRIIPVNEFAHRHFAEWEALTEREFVTRLYKLRRLKLAETINGILNDELPPT